MPGIKEGIDEGKGGGDCRERRIAEIFTFCKTEQ
jgi:hypothetical protein